MQNTARSDQPIRRFEDLEIPSLPSAVLEIIQLVSDPNVSVRALGTAVKKDPALTAMVLKLANSSLFHQRSQVSTLDRAVVLIGLNAMRSLVLGVTVIQAVDKGESGGVDLREFWRDSLLRACLARVIAERFDRTLAEEAYLVGLVQDIGIPLLLRVDPTYAERFQQAKGCRQQLEAQERLGGGITHSDVVRRLCEQWRFPELLTEPLAKHHSRPPATQATDPTLTLWQIAYTVGSLPVGATDLQYLHDPELGDFVQQCFGFDRARFEDVLRGGLEAFEEVQDAYSDLLPAGGDAAAALSVARRLVGVAQDTHQWLSNLSVLVVDPSRIQRTITARMLKGMSVSSVHGAESGAEALALCQKSPPDVVTTAFHLTDMTAPEFEAKLREVPELRDLKVLLISSEDKLDSINFVDDGKLETVPKPLRPAELRRGLSSFSTAEE